MIKEKLLYSYNLAHYFWFIEIMFVDGGKNAGYKYFEENQV